MPFRQHWPAIAAALFAFAWLAAAWQPLFRQDWALENVLSLATAWWLLRHHRRQPLSNLSYSLLLLFAVMHELGSHYTYAEVPYDRWAQAALGFKLSDVFGANRNHYDRLVHFSFGLLCYQPLKEIVAPNLRSGSSSSRYYPLALIALVSLIYEIVEWGAAEIFGGELGQAYLGTQGDLWDAQKDSGLALLGAVIALLFVSLRLRPKKQNM